MAQNTTLPVSWHLNGDTDRKNCLKVQIYVLFSHNHHFSLSNLGVSPLFTAKTLCFLYFLINFVKSYRNT